MQFAIQYAAYDNLFIQGWKSKIAINLQNMTLPTDLVITV